MDAKTVESLGGKITKVIVSYDRKVWRDKKGSVGGSVSAEVSVGAEADADAVVNAVYEWLKEAHKRNTQAVMLEVLSEPTLPQPPATTVPAGPTPAPVTPPPAPIGAPVPLPAPVAEVEIVTLDAPTCAHVFDQGEHRFKVFGGAWKKFGVSAYPEVLAMYNIVGWESWPICKITKAGAEPVNHFALPGGFQRVEVEVKDNKPQRVHSFK